MTFLEILQKMCRRIGYAEPTTTTGLVLDQSLLWDHIVEAYNEIQLSCANLDFLQNIQTIQIAAGKMEFTSVELLQEYARDFDSAGTIADQTGRAEYTIPQVEQMVILDHIARYGEQTVKPTFFSFNKGVLSFNSIVPSPCRLIIGVRRAPYTDTTGSPVWDAEYHDILYHAAMMSYSVDDNDPELYQNSQAKYAELHNRMLLHHSPQIHFEFF